MIKIFFLEEMNRFFININLIPNQAKFCGAQKINTSIFFKDNSEQTTSSVKKEYNAVQSHKVKKCSWFKKKKLNSRMFVFIILSNSKL